MSLFRVTNHHIFLNLERMLCRSEFLLFCVLYGIEFCMFPLHLHAIRSCIHQYPSIVIESYYEFQSHINTFFARLLLQLCLWSIDGWEKKKSRPLQPSPGHQSPLVGDTKVQFHNDQLHVLVVHENIIAVYDSKLECLRSVSS